MGFEIVALVLVGLFVVWKLGVFLIVGDLADTARITSMDYKRSVWSESVQSDQDLGITSEELEKAMTNRATLDSLMAQDLKGKLKVRPSANPTKDV